MDKTPYNSEDEAFGMSYMLVGVDKVRFKRTVEPGDHFN